MNRICDKLDAYLLKELPPDDTAQFAAHLSHCCECRDAVEEQWWIDRLLRAGLASKVESPAEHILRSLRARIGKQRQRIGALVCGLVAAAMAFVAVGWTTLQRQQTENPLAGEHSTNAVSVVDDAAQPSPEARFVGGTDVIAIPVASRHSDVTVVRIYPTYQPAATNQAAVEDSNPATNGSSVNEFNGG
jgi:anti-sigma factor RsiW